MAEGSGVFLAGAVALAVLLISSVLVYRAFPQRYLLVWSAGWVLYLAHMTAGLGADHSGSLFATGLLLAAQAVIASAIGLAAAARPVFLWTLPVAGAALLGEAFASLAAPVAAGWPARIGYLGLGLTGIFWVLQYGNRRPGLGPYLLAAALMLRLVHLPDVIEQPTGNVAAVLETLSVILAMVAMLVLALEAMRQHLRWGAAPGVIASLAADFTAPSRLGTGHAAAAHAADLIGPPATEKVPEQIAVEIQRVFEAAFSRFYLLSSGDAAVREEARFLIEALPRGAAAEPLCATLLVPEKDPPTANWLAERGLRWAVVVPIPNTRAAENSPAAIFVLGYRNRRWLAPELMEALMVTSRQFGILLENALLLRQLSHAYRDWLQTVDAIADLILVHDRQYRILRVNRALADRVGGVPVEIVQRLCREVLPRSGSPWEHCPFCESPGGEDTYDENLRGYFLVSTYHYAQGDMAEVQHVVRDITDRKLAEEKYRTMFEKVHEGVFVSSREGRFLDLNDALARMLGYEREELRAVDISALFLPEERERYLAEMDTQGYVREYEVRLRRKNGEQMTALETSFGTRDESGRVVQFQGFLLDITDRKKAEEQLRQHVSMLSEVNKLAEMLGESLDTRELSHKVAGEVRRIFGADTVAGYLVDRKAKRASMLASEGFVSAPSEERRSFPVSDEFIAAFQRTRRGVVPLVDLPELPQEILDFRTAEKLVSTYVVPLRGEQILGGFTVSWRSERRLSQAEEGLLGAVGRLLNAALENAHLYEQTRQAYDELRRTQEKLLHTDKMAALGQLVSGVAHELNNPLTAIIGYAQLLALEATPPATDYVEKLLRQARRTHRIIQNLLSFSRQHKPERRMLDVNQVIEDTLVLRDFEMQSGNVHVERRLCHDLPQVHGDAHQLEQVFLNIINNACDALRDSDPGGTLKVVTYQDGRHVVAEFRDNGPGLKDPARVFDPFYTTKTVGQGTGLGLSICYGIIKEHGGEITAENAESGGASFRVRLPA